MCTLLSRCFASGSLMINWCFKNRTFWNLVTGVALATTLKTPERFVLFPNSVDFSSCCTMFGLCPDRQAGADYSNRVTESPQAPRRDTTF